MNLILTLKDHDVGIRSQACDKFWTFSNPLDMNMINNVRKRNIVGRSRNHICNVNAYCWVTCHCQQYKSIECCATMLLWRIYFAGNNETYLGLHIKCPMLTVTKCAFSRRILLEIPNITFHGNLSSRSRDDTRGHTDRRTGKTKLKGTSHDYVIAPKIPHYGGWIFLSFQVEHENRRQNYQQSLYCGFKLFLTASLRKFSHFPDPPEDGGIFILPNLGRSSACDDWHCSRFQARIICMCQCSSQTLTFETFPLQAWRRKVCLLPFATKTTQDFRQDSRSWSRDLNQRPPEYGGMLRTRPRYAVAFIIYRHLILVQNTFTHGCCQTGAERTGRELVHFLCGASLRNFTHCGWHESRIYRSR
jgi:hypothetical protein